MDTLLKVSRWIDATNGWIGRSVAWLVLVAALVSASNAVVRKLFDTSSNAWLDAQWWLYAAMFLLAAPWTLRDNDHIRIDVVSGHLSARTRSWIELFGHFFFLLPVTLVILVTAWPYFMTSFLQNEQAKDAGGLPQWPIKALIPLAFALLLAQAVSEIVKRIAILRGLIPDPMEEKIGAHGGVPKPSASDQVPTVRMNPKDKRGDRP